MNKFMECIYDSIQFDTVQEAIKGAGIILTPKNDTSILLWRDSLSHLINYSQIQPWQVINRIPLSNVLCRKIPLSIIIKEGQNLFPSYYDFYPDTYILPDELNLLEKELKNIREKSIKEAKKKIKNQIKNINHEMPIYDTIKLIKKYTTNNRSQSVNTNKNRKTNYSSVYKSDDPNYENEKNEIDKKDEFLIKPSGGSLGRGIKIVQTGEIVDKYSYCNTMYKTPKHSPLKKRQIPAVSQKYVKSHLINDRKFDLRIYVLVSNVEPLEIFVYRDGLARFCSLKSSCKSIFARITNVSMNKNSSFCNKPEKISRLISDVFEENFSEQQQRKIWSEIDDVIVLALFSAHRYLRDGSEKFLKNFKVNNSVYSKSFQIFGFDILLRENDLKPFLIEINYRPSLEFLRNCERRMKVDMIRSAVKIAAPLKPFQVLVNSRKNSFSESFWLDEISRRPELFEQACELKNEAVQQSKFERIWPFDSKKMNENQKKFNEFEKILNKIDQIPMNNQLVLL